MTTIDAKYAEYRNAPCSAEALYAAGNLSPGEHGFSCNLSGQRLVGAPEFILNSEVRNPRTLAYGWTSIAEVAYTWRSFWGTAHHPRDVRHDSGMPLSHGQLQAIVVELPWERLDERAKIRIL